MCANQPDTPWSVDRKMSTTHDIALAVSAGGHAPTREKLLTLFDCSVGANADLMALPEQRRAAIRGLACLFSRVDDALLDAFPSLEIVASFGVGYDHVDAHACARRSVVVTHTPGVLDDEVADTAIGLLINTLRDLPRAEAFLRAGNWRPGSAFPLSSLTLRARTVGIFGMGRIGSAIARRLEGFGVAIRYHNRRPVDGVPYAYDASLLDLARNCDTLICVAPATPQTRNAINAEVLAALGEHGVLINVGRGATVDEPALVSALSTGVIAAAGLDVFADEPNVPQDLIDLPNAVLLPHVASASVHTRSAMGDLVIANLQAWFAGKPALTPVPETEALNIRTAS